MIGYSRFATADDIPDAVRTADTMAILDLPSSTFYFLRTNGTLPVPEKFPRIGKRPRYDGRWLRAWYLGELTPDGRVPSRSFASGRKAG